MAEQDEVREMFVRLGGKIKEAGEAHIRDEIRGGFTKLPPITTGVAKLARLEFYKDEGILRFRAVGIVDCPMYGEGGIPVKGLETTQFAALTDVDYDKSVSDIFDVFRKLVGQATLDVLYGQFKASPDYLMQIAKAITAANAKNPIYFRFSNALEENRNGKQDPKTGKPYPARTWERWQSAIPGYYPLSATSTSPTTTPQPSANGTHTPTPAVNGAHNPAPWSNRQSTPAPASQPTTTTVAQAVVEDWDQVVADAVLDNDDAKGKLEDAALSLGYTKEDVKNSEDWEQVGDWVRAGVKKGGESTATATLPARTGEAVVGNVVKYQPQDKKYPSDPTKRTISSVDCEIISLVGLDQMTIKALGGKSKGTNYVVSVSDQYVTYPSRS